MDIQVITVELDDELTDVLLKIGEATSAHVWLKIPGSSLLLTSSVNLKLMLKKAHGKQAVLTLITRDSVGRRLAEKVSLSSFATEEEAKDSIDSVTGVTATPIILQKRLSSNKSEKEDVKALPKGILAKLQYLFTGKKKAEEDTIVEEITADSLYTLSLKKPSRKAFLAVFFSSIFVLIIIVFFALPDATIVIRPKMSVVSAVTNVTLGDGKTSIADRYVHRVPIEVTYTKEMTYGASGENVQGVQARGRVRVYNNSSEDRSIVGNSRLQNEEGLVFLTTRFVTISSKSSAEVEVVARERDINGKFIGERGNVSGAKFFFPALNTSSQRLIYAESTTQMSGGSTDRKSIIRSEDLALANESIVKELENLAPEEVQAALKKELGATAGSFAIFAPQDSRFISRDLISATLPENIVGKEQEGFKVIGTMKARAWYYNVDEMADVLEEYMIQHRLTYKEELLSMDRSSYELQNIFPPSQNEVKITAQMQGVITFSKENTLDKVVEEIVSRVVGVDKNAAASYIQNLPEVDTVDIHLFPWWQKTLPAIKGNIKVDVEVRSK